MNFYPLELAFFSVNVSALSSRGPRVFPVKVIHGHFLSFVAVNGAVPPPAHLAAAHCASLPRTPLLARASFHLRDQISFKAPSSPHLPGLAGSLATGSNPSFGSGLGVGRAGLGQQARVPWFWAS